MSDASTSLGRVVIAGGTGFLASAVSVAGVVDAMYRAVRALRSTTRRSTIASNGMTTDWSWETPAAQYRALYDEAVGA